MKVGSKIDAWHIISFILIMGILALPMFVFKFSVVYLAIYCVIFLIYVAIEFFVSYTLSDESLVVRMAFIKFDIKYDRILRVSKVKTFESSCATALRCVEIKFGSRESSKHNRIYISPKNEEEFVQLLNEKCPNIKEIKNERK